MPKVIDSFSGEYRFLSNFYPKPFKWRGKTWPSSEHAYQAAKAKDKDDAELIRQASTPGKAKRLGRKIKIREDWEDTKVKIMYSILKAKFKDPELRAMLKDTGKAKLIEGNTWGDRVWGVYNGQGKNYLGKLLMKVRNKL